MSQHFKTRPATGNIPPFGLRMQPDMKERVEQLAKSSGRSMNAMIVYMIQAYFDEVDRQNYEKSPEYWEGLEQAAREAMPDVPAKSMNEHLALKRAEKEADLVADKVVAKLIDLEKIQRVIELAARSLEQSGERTGDNSKPSSTPVIPGVNAPKGGSKAPKK